MTPHAAPAGSILVVTGTGTDIGKTVGTAAVAAVLRSAGVSVGLCKPVQTGLAPGEPGDVAEAAAWAGIDATAEFHRYPEPLAPETAARRAGMEPPRLVPLCDAIESFARESGVTIVEGAGGVLVRLGPGLTIIDVAAELAARGNAVHALVVTRAALGTLSDTELAVDRLRGAGVDVLGTLIGAWPSSPDLAESCNLEDLPRLTGVPLLGAIPERVGGLPPAEFARSAAGWIDTEALGALVPGDRLT